MVFLLACPTLVSAQTSETPSATSFIYDGSGARIARIEQNGKHTYYINSGLEITITPDQKVTWNRNYSLSGISAVRQGSVSGENLYYIHKDLIGSTVLVSDASGNALTYQSYYPYGTVKDKGSSIPTDRQYTGQVSDESQTGLYYYNARYYNPVWGKFTQADRANDDVNRYAYVGNNPVNRIDPSGKAVEGTGGIGGYGTTSTTATSLRPLRSRGECMYGCHNGDSGILFNPGTPMPEEDQTLMSVTVLEAIMTSFAIAGNPYVGEVVDTFFCLVHGGGPPCYNPSPFTSISTGKRFFDTKSHEGSPLDSLSLVLDPDDINLNNATLNAFYSIGLDEIPTQRRKIEKITQYVYGRMNYSIKKEEIIYQEQAGMALLGDFVACRIGVCKEKAAFAQVLLQKAGVSSAALIASSQSSGSNGHTFVRVVDEAGTILVADPTWNFVLPWEEAVQRYSASGYVYNNNSLIPWAGNP